MFECDSTIESLRVKSVFFADILRVLYEIIGGDNLRSIVVVVIITTTLSVSVWKLEVDINDLLIALHFMY